MGWGSERPAAHTQQTLTQVLPPGVKAGKRLKMQIQTSGYRTGAHENSFFIFSHTRDMIVTVC